MPKEMQDLLKRAQESMKETILKAVDQKVKK